MSRYVYHYNVTDINSGQGWDGIINTDIRVDSMQEYFKLAAVLSSTLGTGLLKFNSLSLLFENKAPLPNTGPQ